MAANLAGSTTLCTRAFLGEKPAGLEVCHQDGVATDTRLFQLRYDTRAANVADCIRHGTHPSCRRKRFGPRWEDREEEDTA